MPTTIASRERKNAARRQQRQRQKSARFPPLVGRVVHDVTDPTVRGMVRTVTASSVAIKTAAGAIVRIKRQNVKIGSRPPKTGLDRHDRRTHNRVEKKFERVLSEHGIGRDVVELRAHHNGLSIEETLNALLGIGF